MSITTAIEALQTAVEAQTALFATELPLLRTIATYGNVFPTSPVPYERFFRTDLGMSCYYDGTRWLSEEYHATFPWRDVTKSAASDDAVLIDLSANIYITTYKLRFSVSTLNNSSNYWVFIPLIEGRWTAPSYITTQSYLINSINNLTTTYNTVVTNAAKARQTSTPVGSPGTMSFGGRLSYHLILT